MTRQRSSRHSLTPRKGKAVGPSLPALSRLLGVPFPKSAANPPREPESRARAKCFPYVQIQPLCVRDAPEAAATCDCTLKKTPCVSLKRTRGRTPLSRAMNARAMIKH
jgi:hypothetical protein